MRGFLERISQHQIVYHILAVAVASVWGITFVSSKILLLSGLKPADVIFYRFVLAYVGICIISRPFKLFANTRKDELLCMLMGFFGGTLYFITENMALKHTNVSNVSLICGTTPLLTMLIQYYVIKRTKPHNRMLVGSLITLLGVAAVIFNSNFILKINPIGDFLCLLSALSWTLYTLISKHLSERYNAIFLVRKTFIYGIITLAPTFLFSPLTTSTEVLSQSVVWSHLLFLGAIGSFLCFIVWNKCLQKIDTVILSNYIYLMPVISIIASTMILGESLNIIIAAGAVMVITGLYMAGKR